MKHAQRQSGKPAFDLIEESVHLLRSAPVATLATYYLGAIPCVLGFLFFWADMSRNPFAFQHLADASFVMTLLFLWMKFWQAIFARQIRAQMAAEQLPEMNFRRGIRIFFSQAMVQSSGLFLIPLSIIPVLSFSWVYTFYQNATVLAGVREEHLFKKSWQQTKLWPMQNHLVLGILAAFGFYVFLNWVTVCYALPGLLKMLLGVESVFTKSPMSLFNSTFFAAMFGLTYLCADPVLKVIYALRCFYGESLQSGEDLKAELKPFSFVPQKIAATILICAAIFISIPAAGAEPAPAANPQNVSRVSPADLDKAINETIHERKYTWRMPRGKIVEADSQEGFLEKFFNAIGQTLRKWARAVLHWWQDLMRKLFRHPPTSLSHNEPDFSWIVGVEMLLYVLVAVAVAALAVFLYRVWRDRDKSRTTVAAQAVQSAPDIADENVRADQLPEDGWIRLARELLERGEFRLAMRAFYLASLSHLAAKNLISIARFKSNRDYERELRRRAHAFPNLLLIFGENVSVFERIWYGMHEVNRDLVAQFSANVERIKTAG
ncbi:MAG TPA: hypothetical protein VFV23_00770 [Verrucomicrobiae bacterium]|nr:hypothetical protein [Verrucomicrobiae bacterium]